MIKVNVRTNDNRPRSSAEVKRLLQDIAFALRTSRQMKMEIMSADKDVERREGQPAVHSASAACAA